MKITCGKCGNTFDGYEAWAGHPCEVHAREADAEKSTKTKADAPLPEDSG